jgi:NAD(P)-dependent dehydrogenase (short-subunit alcohol dehydrogenase family)
MQLQKVHARYSVSWNYIWPLFLIVMCLAASSWSAAFAEEIAADDVEAQPYTVLITGANRGIGLEFVKQYSADGWRVIATARNPEAATDLQALAAANPAIIIEQLDVNDLPRIDALAEKYREQPIDILLNNAAISGSPMREQSFRHLDYDLFDDFMQTNARGPLKMCEAFLSQVQNSELKTMVVVSSLAGSFSASRPAKATYFYRASKVAVNMLMVQVSNDVKRRDIKVVMVNPGLVDTQGVLAEMNEKMKLGLTLTPIEESIAGMKRVIADTPIEDSGLLFQWTGERIPF